MNEILKTRREINYSSLVYDFKGSIALISFFKFGGPIYTYDELKKGEKHCNKQKKSKIIFKNI